MSEVKRVFIPEPIHGDGIAQLRGEGIECVVPWESGDDPGAAWQQHAADIHGVVVRLFEINAARLRQAVQLQAVAKHGVGIDNIDCDESTRRGIPVLTIGTANSTAVAAHALGLSLIHI